MPVRICHSGGAVEQGARTPALATPGLRREAKVYMSTTCGRKHGSDSIGSPGYGTSRFTKVLRKPLHGRAYTHPHTVSEYLRVEWPTVGGICQRVYQELSQSLCFNCLENIGLTKPANKKGTSI